MALGKQAKILNPKQVNVVLNYLDGTQDPIRNRVIFLLSTKAGLRAKEIANLTWDMATDSEGNLCDHISLTDRATKGKSGRTIPLNKILKDHLLELKHLVLKGTDTRQRIIKSQRSDKVSAQTIVNLFSHWYSELGMVGCSSHSGRRTFITNAARKVGEVGGSLRDVQIMAGHSSLSMTQRYIEADSNAQAKLVNLI